MRIGNVWQNDSFFSQIMGGTHHLVECVDDLNGVDLLVFWGGEDVHPNMYGETSVYAHTSPSSRERDKFESFIFQKALFTIPIIGICRGSQFACAQLGGKLWQHVDGHNSDHKIKMQDGRIIPVTSTHHQMMRPNEHMEVLAVAEKNLSTRKKNASGEFVLPDEGEAEICYAQNENVLMIQGHPEYSNANKEFVGLTVELIEKYLGVKK